MNRVKSFFGPHTTTPASHNLNREFPSELGDDDRLCLTELAPRIIWIMLNMIKPIPCKHYLCRCIQKVRSGQTEKQHSLQTSSFVFSFYKLVCSAASKKSYSYFHEFCTFFYQTNLHWIKLKLFLLNFSE